MILPTAVQLRSVFYARHHHINSWFQALENSSDAVVPVFGNYPPRFGLYGIIAAMLLIRLPGLAGGSGRTIMTITNRDE